MFGEVPFIFRSVVQLLSNVTEKFGYQVTVSFTMAFMASHPPNLNLKLNTLKTKALFSSNLVLSILSMNGTTASNFPNLDC